VLAGARIGGEGGSEKGPALNQPDTGAGRTHRDEREDLAHALAATKRLKGCQSLPDYVIEAVDAFADLLAHYAPERSLKAVPSAGPSAPQSHRPSLQQPPLLR
jgi:hypothetical protein